MFFSTFVRRKSDKHVMTSILLYGARIQSWAWVLMAIVVVVPLILLYYKVYYRLMVRRMTAVSRQRNERLNLMLMASHVNIWVYDVDTKLLTCHIAGNDKPEIMTIAEFSARYGHEVFEQVKEKANRVIAGELEEEATELTLTKNGDTNDYQIVIRPLHRNANGRPTAIIITRNDITEQQRRQRKAKQLLLQYQSIFDCAMVDMMYFDADGLMVEANQKARETFHLDTDAIRRREVTFYDLLRLDEQHFKEDDYFYATLCIGQMYYELQMVALSDDHGGTLGFYASGRDVTEQVQAYRQQQDDTNALATATMETERYVNNINYVLNVSGVRMADYVPDTHTITIYKGIGQVQLKLTPARYMTIVSKQSMPAVLNVLNKMDNRSGESLDVEVETTLRVAGHPLILHFDFMPIYSQQGEINNYMGMCRDMSIIKATEEELELKTQNAQKAEAEKNAFLRNMSYEIRTPLNTVVGFAELFEEPHSSDDEAVYISQIKNNSEFLLHLINDILFLSRLDAKMVEINPQPTDFAKAFENHCKAAWKDYRREGVHYIVENDFERLVVNIDNMNVGHIINQVIQNAAIHTKSGFVRAHYDYVGRKLVIVVDDTGTGIGKQTLSTIYERFSVNSQGTGLGLPICKELLSQMGGNIDISSTSGQGTTVWITLPCEATVIEKKDV